MQFKLLVETAILLALAQFILGAAGYLLKGIPWLGLPLLFFFGWLIVRTAQVLREEMAVAARRGVPLMPPVTALLVAVLWQLPALAFVPRWAPAPAIRIWQGALLSIPGTLERFPSTALPVEPVLWLALPLEIALFVWVAARNVVPVRRPAPRAAAAAAQMSGGPAATGGTGEWAPARRLKDTARRRPTPEITLEIEPEVDPAVEPGEKE